MAEMEKTCDNCKHKDKWIDQHPCSECIHTAGDMFEPKRSILKKRWSRDDRK